MFTKKRVAATVEKLLRSALENANYLSSEKGIDVDVDKLYVKHAVANDGPRMKRIRPAPMGRAFRYHAAHRAHRDRAGGARQEWRSAGDCGRRRSRRGQGEGAAEATAGSKDSGKQEVSFGEEVDRQERNGRIQEKQWDKKFILTVFGWATPSRGGRAGLRSAITTSCCSKTSS